MAVGAHNPLCRFTASGNVAVPGSEKVLLELGTVWTAMVHDGAEIYSSPSAAKYVAQ